MLAWLFGKKCVVCGKKAHQPRPYFDAQGRKVHVCAMCVPYAERRAFRKR